MDYSENLTLSVDSSTDLLRNRTVLAALTDIKPRSQAGNHLRLAPDFTEEKAQELLRDFTVIYREIGRHSLGLVLRRESILVHADLSIASLRIEVMAGNESADTILAELLQRFEPHVFVNQEPDGVWADFTYEGGQGLARQTQFLRCPSWSDIQANYPATTRSAMDRLLNLKAPWKSGRLIIWHGPPGTGKTYAIRSMLKAWKQQFDFVIINDPENFAASPGYYYKVSSRSHQFPSRYKLAAAAAYRDEDDCDEDGGDADDSKRKRHLFILEDSADLIMQESRASHYDKLGKLLNMTDGLFGQGREDLFMLTFNEEVTRIDPAFLRPGRCITKIEFPKFSPDAGVAWLARHGMSDVRISQDISLAELYAKILSSEGAPLQVPIPKRQIGFGK